VSPELTTQEQSIRSQVELSERALDGLEADLRSIDAELEALAEDHHKYDVLKRVCQNLEELDDLDAAELFWDGHGDERNRRIDHELRRIDIPGGWPRHCRRRFRAGIHRDATPVAATRRVAAAGTP